MILSSELICFSALDLVENDKLNSLKLESICSQKLIFKNADKHKIELSIELKPIKSLIIIKFCAF